MSDNDYQYINVKIDYILNEKIEETGKNMLELLLECIPNMINISINIYKNQEEEQMQQYDNIKEILITYFNNLNVFGSLLSENIKNMLFQNDTVIRFR